MTIGGPSLPLVCTDSPLLAAQAVGGPSLQNSLDQLALLGVGHGSIAFASMLTQVANLAITALPTADAAGLTVFEDRHADTSVATCDAVRELDDLQFALGEGPTISAMADAVAVRSGSLGGDHAWPRFGPAGERLGIESALAFPLLAESEPVGVLNVYSRTRDAFDEQAAELGQLFANPATVSVRNARALFQAQRLVDEMQEAMSNRAVIDQAAGILMSRSGYRPDEAIDKLRHYSQIENRKLVVVAARIVDEAVRQARSRRQSA